MFSYIQTHGVFVIILVNIYCVTSQQEGDIRLAGTNSNATHGRLEVYHNNIWGTVCNDQFGTDDAVVVCRQLGHSTSGARFFDAAGEGQPYGEGTGPIWMDNVQCTAVEFRLVDCQFGGWNRTDCRHEEDVGVACVSTTSSPPPVTQPPATAAPIVPEDGNCSTPDSTIRLLSPTDREGMGVVQVFRNGIWGGICDNNWDINDARVVCRMLCYNASNALPGGRDIDVSNITDPMVIESMNCVGNERNISECPQSVWANNSCGRNEMATVTCVPVNTEPVRPEPVLQCTNGRLTASFSTVKDKYLERKHLTIAYSYNGTCNLVWGNSTTDISIGIPFGDCGTRRVSNGTHQIYNNTIKYASTYTSANGLITFANTYMIEVKCELPIDVNANRPVVPITETVTQSAQGEFDVALQFFRDTQFYTPETEFPLEIPLGEYLYPAVTLDNVDSTLQLVIHNCTATPTANKDDPISYALIKDKCVEDSSVQLYPINKTMWAWGYQTFKFVQFGEVHLHCDALICGDEETSPVCDRSCDRQTSTTAPVSSTTFNPVGRKKRSAGRGIRSVQISSSTIIVYDPNLPPQIERPSYTVVPEIQTRTTTTIKTTTTLKHSSSSQPPITRKPSTDKPETPPLSTTSQSGPSQTPSISVSQTQAPPSTRAPNSSVEIVETIQAPPIDIDVLSKGSVFVFSLFSLSQFLLCLTLFYFLI